MVKSTFETSYINPLINNDFPDPSIIEVAGKGFFAYATHDEFSPTINNIQVSHSWDLVNWSPATGTLLSAPLWAKLCHKFWCPHVVQSGNEFRLYYAAEPDTKDGMCLALATSTGPTEFTDCGEPISRLAGSTYQMIDPCCFIDPVSKRNLLYYGSAHEPIWAVELAPDGSTFITQPVAVLYPGVGPFQQLREGAFVTYNEQFSRYFLWVSGDNTWAANGYAISVFWSPDPLGAFEQVPGDHVILKPNEHWDAPGQNCMIKDAASNEWMIYHAVDTTDRFIEGTNIFKRKMCMDRVLYNSEGWPYVESGSPSFETQPGPVVATSNDEPAT